VKTYIGIAGVLGIAGGFIAGAWLARPSGPLHDLLNGNSPSAIDEHESHEEHAEHDGHEEHAAHEDAGHDEHDHETKALRLSPAAILASGIEVEEARAGELANALTLPGEIALNSDKLAHIVPRVGGIVARVDKTLGDVVEAGEVMGILESRELAEAKAAYLAAMQRLPLAHAQVTSSESLAAKGIVSGLEKLAAERELATAEIDLRTAESKLHALGIPQDDLKGLGDQSDARFGVYVLRAPFAGTVIERHFTLGELVTPETQCFVLADLSTVWFNVTVYAQDLPRIRSGQKVDVRDSTGERSASGEISYISPIVDENSRSATARVVLTNSEVPWRPGEFATAAIQVSTQRAEVIVPNDAIQRIGDAFVVFVEADGAFEPRPVEIAARGPSQTAIRSGLQAGEKYVARGAFILKSELGKSQAVHQH
jgi:cobalt-zinc-cadmium efflux system membrane fusion protein